MSCYIMMTGAWKDHGSASGGFYACNKYKELTAKGVYSKEEKSMLSSQKILQKYVIDGYCYYYDWLALLINRWVLYDNNVHEFHLLNII